MMIVKYCTPSDYLEIEQSGKIPKLNELFYKNFPDYIAH